MFLEIGVFVGGEICTLTTGEFINRTILVEQPESYGTVCWELCESCQLTGCTDFDYIEFDPFAVLDDGSCSELKVYGCTYDFAVNFNPQANLDDQTCFFTPTTCPQDLNFDGNVTAADLTQFLALFGLPCE